MTLTSRATGLGDQPALVVVDASRGFTDPESPLGADFSTEIRVINRLLALAHARAWPVFLSTVVYHRPEQARIFRAKLPDLDVLQEGSSWVALDERLDLAESDQVLEKTHASCFHGTDLAARLRDADVNTVVVTGFTTSGCVRATAVDSLQHDFYTLVVSDAVGDRDAKAHAANLHDLQTKYADVVDSGALAALCAGRHTR